MIYFPCAKINVGLNVVERRMDGFHNIESIMVPIYSFCDILEIVPRGISGVKFSKSGLEVDCSQRDNLCVRAYNIMQERYDIGGVEMHLHKRIPSGAGLGGGSADAAQTIKALNELFDIGLSLDTMEHLAGELGSDTIFFIRNTPQLVEGRGETLCPSPIMEQLQGKLVVIIKPDIFISTAEAYAGITPHRPKRHITRLTTEDIKQWRNEIINDFEPHITYNNPIIGQIKEQLYELGAVYASMSGSGSSVYGIFNSPDSRQNLDPNRISHVALSPFAELSKEIKHAFTHHSIHQHIIRDRR